MPADAYTRDIAELKQNTPISINALVKAFDYPRSSLRLALEYYLHRAGNRGSRLFFIEILNSKLLTGFDKGPKAAHQLRNKKSSITARAISKLQSIAAG
jgi:hypothetical protein